MNRSKYKKENRCGASCSDGVDLADDAYSNCGFAIRYANYERVVS